MDAISVPLQYNVADYIQWHRAGTLMLNPAFQRNAIWKKDASSYFVDTILRGYPSSKIFIRIKVDPRTLATIREVVDGQQRLRAILDFVDGKLPLSRRAGEFAGNVYSSLSPDLQESFLKYVISTEQLFNVSDNHVLEMFARINSYNVKLNDAELRHAEFQGPFKWAIREASSRHHLLWEEFGVLSLQQRVRMLDDALMAEMFAVILEGVNDGGANAIYKLYKKYDKPIFPVEELSRKVDQAIEYILANYQRVLRTGVLGTPNFLMLFAAVCHKLFTIPQGRIDPWPPHTSISYFGDDPEENLLFLCQLLGEDSLQEFPKNAVEEDSLMDFLNASRTTTQRISSRNIRFQVLFSAIQASK